MKVVNMRCMYLLAFVKQFRHLMAATSPKSDFCLICSMESHVIGQQTNVNKRLAILEILRIVRHLLDCLAMCLGRPSFSIGG